MVTMPHSPSPERLDTKRSGLLVVDLQEKLLPAIPSGDAVVSQTRRLLEASSELDVPVASTVQYPQGLGPLDPSIAELVGPPEEKIDFSAAVCRGALDAWIDSGRDQIVICGIETHICILQTTLDLLAESLRVFVVAEAVAARHGQDHELALTRMRDGGASIVTAESVLFEWLVSAEHPKFKTVSNMVKSFKPPKRDRKPPHDRPPRPPRR